MPGHYNSDGIKVDNFFNGPDGEYILKIVNVDAGTTAKGDPKVTVDYEIAEGPMMGIPINFHTITFFRDKENRGSGIAIKFLKSIGQPHEGEFEWNELNWIGKRLRAMVVMEVQSFGKRAGNSFPKIKWVEPCVALEELPF